MGSYTFSIDQALAGQKSRTAGLAACAGIYLAVKGGLALADQRGWWPYSRHSPEGAVAAVFLFELFFAAMLLCISARRSGARSRSSAPGGGKCAFVFVGAMLGLEAVVLSQVAVSCRAGWGAWVFAWSWMVSGLQFVYESFTGAVDRVMAARERPAANS